MREWELSGRTGEWEPSNQANPASKDAVESIVQDVHIQMKPVTLEQVEALEPEALEAGLLTDNPAAFGILTDPTITGDEGE